MRGLTALLLAMALSGTAAAATPLDTLVPTHPRLLMDPASEAARIQRLASGKAPALASLVALMRARREALLAAAPVQRIIRDRRLLGVSQNVLERAMTLGLLWRLTGDAAARDRLKSDLLAAAAFSDWNPSHFLDVAEMTAGMALGYDWLHDQFTVAERDALAKAIRDKGLKPGDKDGLWWVASDINWNQVCHGGLVLGALAIGEREPVLAARIIERARVNHAKALVVYEPDGVYPEGPSYWSYGTEYSVLMDQALMTASGTDWGLWQRSGVVRSFDYLMHVTGPTGQTFNYSDAATSGTVIPACAGWAAKRLGRLALSAWAWSQVPSTYAQWVVQAPATGSSRFTPLLALTDEPTAQVSHPSATAWVGRGEVQVACLRRDWSDGTSPFIAMKGGKLRINHGHLDAGTFVIDALGRRWAGELGLDKDIYARTDAWGTEVGSKRWTYLRVNNLGHNVVVLGNRLQDPEGDNPLAGPFTWDGFAGASADCAAAYRGQAAGARRGIAVLGGRALLVRDEFAGLAAGLDARWQLHTLATVEVAADRRSVLLRLDGAALRLRAAVAPDAARFAVVDPIPVPAGQQPLTGWRRVDLTVPAPLPDHLVLAVVADADGAQPIDPPDLPIAEWPRARGIRVVAEPPPPGGTRVQLDDGAAEREHQPHAGATFDGLTPSSDHTLGLTPTAPTGAN